LKRLYIIWFGVFVITTFHVFSQNNDTLQFEKCYEQLLLRNKNFYDSIQYSLYDLESNFQLTNIQNAKLNYMKSWMFDLYRIDEKRMTMHDPVVDSVSKSSLLTRAVRLIIQSRTTTGIPLLLQYIETADPDADSTVYANIYLAEAYRKIIDYQKGMDVIYNLLKSGKVSEENRAFAYNRLAAIYAECGSYMYKHRRDSVVKYSYLCIDISEKYNLPYHRGTAQNELAYYYSTSKEAYQLALF